MRRTGSRQVTGLTRLLVGHDRTTIRVRVRLWRPDQFFSSSSGYDPASNDPSVSAAAASAKWRKTQLIEIEGKFVDQGVTDPTAVKKPASGGTGSSTKSHSDAVDEPLNIESDADLQQMWKDMENRVTRRRPLTADQRGGKVGRRNVRKSDEDLWLQAGLYDDNGDNPSK